MLGLIVGDGITAIIGSLLWKQANRLDPASEKDKFRFFVQNQLGLLITIVAFFPLVLLILTDKNWIVNTYSDHFIKVYYLIYIA